MHTQTYQSPMQGRACVHFVFMMVLRRSRAGRSMLGIHLEAWWCAGMAKTMLSTRTKHIALRHFQLFPSVSTLVRVDYSPVQCHGTALLSGLCSRQCKIIFASVPPLRALSLLVEHSVGSFLRRIHIAQHRQPKLFYKMIGQLWIVMVMIWTYTDCTGRG